MEDLAICETCGKTGSDLQQCAACKSVKYCDVHCQRKNWKSHKKLCKLKKSTSNNPHKTVEAEASSSSTKKCDSCGKSGVKLWRCEGCKEVRYCGSVCQKRDWATHEENCCVIKIVHTNSITKPGVSRIERNMITGKVAEISCDDTEQFIDRDSRIIVKIQTSYYASQPLSSLKRADLANMRVYNQSGNYDRFIETWDENYTLLENKVLKDGQLCAERHPLLKKMYFKAHLNPDLTLDVYLNCTYDNQNW